MLFSSSFIASTLKEEQKSRIEKNLIQVLKVSRTITERDTETCEVKCVSEHSDSRIGCAGLNG